MSFSRAFGRFALVAVLAAAAVIPFAAPVALGNSAPSTAEGHALDLINAERAQKGRAALRWDARVSDIAQWRSDVQASNDSMTHDLTAVGDKFERNGIKWFNLGEALLHGTPRSLWSSAEEAVATWKGSKAHWDMLMSYTAPYNYVALGVAKARDGWYYWTAILFEGPDRTAPKATMSNVSARKLAGGGSSVTVSWSGHDVQLFTRTAGLRDFKLQRRTGSGDWVTVTAWTTATSRTFELASSRSYSFRVRARDRVGNVSHWSTRLTINT